MVGKQKWKQKQKAGVICYRTDDGDLDQSLVEIKINGQIPDLGTEIKEQIHQLNLRMDQVLGWGW